MKSIGFGGEPQLVGFAGNVVREKKEFLYYKINIMKEGISKHLALLAVELYEISEKFIYELREKQHQSQDVFDYLPEYTINKNEKVNNQPIPARYYHQFVGSLEPQDDGEKYLYFRVMSPDTLLDHEISEAGFEDLFDGVDFEKLLSVFPAEPQENLTKFVFPTTHYLVVELVYITSYDHYSGGYDCDMEIDIVGYLDHGLQRQPFEVPKRSDNAFKVGDKVKLPFNEEGEVLEYVDLPWASRYNVRITKSRGMRTEGDVEDFFERDLELLK